LYYLTPFKPEENRI